MTDKSKTKPKHDVLIVLENCRVDGLGALSAGLEILGADIIKYKALMSAKHYKVIKR